MHLPVLVDASEAHMLLTEHPQTAVLDVRWSLTKPHQRDIYLAGHLPGAIYVDMDTHLSTDNAPASAGRHPVPSTAQLQESVRALGLTSLDAPVLVYDDVQAQAAARAWWLLVRAGFTRVHVLDGGYQTWLRAGLPVDTREVTPPSSTLNLHPAPERLPSITRNDVPRFAARHTLIDVRAPERFSGEHEPVDPVAGHIPGATNIPATQLLTDTGFLDRESLLRVFGAHGIADGDDVAVYCGSGITAAQAALALTNTHITAHVFAPSWSGWIHGKDEPHA